MAYKNWLTGVLLALTVPSGLGQAALQMAPEAHPSFEVATIKPSDPDSRRQGFDAEGHHVTVLGETLSDMMVFAYQVHKEQIVGVLGWMSNDKYDVDGIADAEGEPSLSQMQEMVRKLLVERLGLAFHHEQREISYYAISVSKGGSKLAKSAALDDKMPHQSMNGNAKQMEIKFRNNEMSDFALGMQYFSDKPVVDETGLLGRFDFTLKWRTNDTQAADVDGPPTLFTAMNEQLGLKLLPKKGPVDVMVVDKVSRPSAN